MISIVLSDLLTDLLGNEARIEVASSFQEAANYSEPALVVLDLNLTDTQGVDTIDRFKSQFPDSYLLICSGEIDQHTRQSVEERQLTFVNKTSAYPVLYQAMEAALRQSGLLSDRSRSSKMQHSEHHSNIYAPGSDKPLTLKQVDIMRRTAEGLSAKEVARDLGISPDTVRGHMKEIFIRLGAKNKGQAVDIFVKAERQAKLLDGDKEAD